MVAFTNIDVVGEPAYSQKPSYKGDLQMKFLGIAGLNNPHLGYGQWRSEQFHSICTPERRLSKWHGVRFGDLTEEGFHLSSWREGNEEPAR